MGQARTTRAGFFKAFVFALSLDRARRPNLLGQSYASRVAHAGGGRVHQVIDSYASKPEAPRRWWLLAQSDVEMHLCSDARQIRPGPGPPLSPLAARPRGQDQAAELQRIAKDSACAPANHRGLPVGWMSDHRLPRGCATGHGRKARGQWLTGTELGLGE